jgi:hypothetical protein
MFVLSTVILSIAGSRIANEPSDLASWSVVLGAACLMFLADTYREFEQSAHALVTSRFPLRVTRRDIVHDHNDQAHAAALILATAAIVGGALLPNAVPYISAKFRSPESPASTGRPITTPAETTRLPTTQIPASPSPSR